MYWKYEKVPVFCPNLANVPVFWQSPPPRFIKCEVYIPVIIFPRFLINFSEQSHLAILVLYTMQDLSLSAVILRRIILIFQNLNLLILVNNVCILYHRKRGWVSWLELLRCGPGPLYSSKTCSVHNWRLFL